MAVKKATKSKAEPKIPSKANSKQDQDKKEKFRLVFGVIGLSLTLYLFLAFVSFLFHAEADQSKLQINWFKLIADAEIKVANVTGKTGAWLADVFINRWFGISSFLFL
jgi:DNA segregation ATPase FtsK/SpoIIIE, S-DNA-T family